MKPPRGKAAAGKADPNDLTPHWSTVTTCLSELKVNVKMCTWHCCMLVPSDFTPLPLTCFILLLFTLGCRMSHLSPLFRTFITFMHVHCLWAFLMMVQELAEKLGRGRAACEKELKQVGGWHCVYIGSQGVLLMTDESCQLFSIVCACTVGLACHLSQVMMCLVGSASAAPAWGAPA